MPNKKRKRGLEGDNIQQGDQNTPKDPVIIQNDEKFPVEIREIVRIRPQDFHALKNSFEEWFNKWDT